MTDKVCPHDQGMTPSWDYSTCNVCGWVFPSGQCRGPNNGFFPSMAAVKEFDKYKYYPGMNKIKPTIP